MFNDDVAKFVDIERTTLGGASTPLTTAEPQPAASPESTSEPIPPLADAA
jgi:hypothetical protein